MIVVNLFGAPGSGKSTGAAYIFSQLKMAGINAELVTEFAKDKVWEENSEVFKPDNQCYLFGKQFYRMSRCRGKVDVIITDSPLPLCIHYNKSWVLGESFNNVVMNCFRSFNNINFFLLRDKPYNPKGRLQTEEESDAISRELEDMLTNRKICYTKAKGNKSVYDGIVGEVAQLVMEIKKEEE